MQFLYVEGDTEHLHGQHAEDFHVIDGDYISIADGEDGGGGEVEGVKISLHAVHVGLAVMHQPVTFCIVEADQIDKQSLNRRIVTKQCSIEMILLSRSKILK